MTAPPPPCLLLIEEDPLAAKNLAQTLRALTSGRVELATSLQAGQAFARANTCSLILVNAVQADPRMGGIEEVQNQFSAPVIFLLPHATLAGALGLEPWSWIAAPFAEVDVQRAVAFAFRLRAVEARLQTAQRRLRQEEALADLGRSAVRAGADFQHTLDQLRGHLGQLAPLSTPAMGPSLLAVEQVLQRGERVACQLCGAESPPTPETERLAVRPRSNTVLVVDDDESIRELAACVIRRMGWQAVTARDGEEAFLRFQADPGFFSMALVDLSLPRLSGVELISGIRSLRPAMPVVLITGHGDETLSNDPKLALSGLLRKPFDTDALRTVLQRAVSAEAPSIVPAGLVA